MRLPIQNPKLVLSSSLALLVSFLFPVAASGQETPREVRQKAQMLLGQGDYMNVIPLLQQLIDWYGESKKPELQASLEAVYYSLGCCFFYVGQFSEARSAFETYTKKYKNGPHVPEVAVYIADSLRFEGNFDKALKTYKNALKTYQFGPDLKADIFQAMVRCYLSQDKWKAAMPWLRRLYIEAPDMTRRNWAATLLTTAFLKERQLDRVYELVPFLLLPDSFASRSVALNITALECGDELFGEEKYRDSLWIYRLVYPHDVLSVRSQEYLEFLQRRADRLKRVSDFPRALMRVQEGIAEVEEEIKALAKVENYDIELFFRIGRSYMEIFRYREAREVFLFLYGECKGQRAEEALYLAFKCSIQVQPVERAFKLGQEYMKVYPGGEYYDEITLTMGQMYAKREDWPQVIAVLTKALEVSPKHQEAAECMFLIGYASFMEEKFEDTVTWLRKMNKTYPGNPREADGTYWLGMALMFDKKFEEAAVEFDMMLKQFADSIYLVDSAFRRAVCEYGQSKYKEAEVMLEAFVTQYPTNKLSGEGYVMLGDISGVFSELDRAVERFQQVSRYEINIELYNHAMFRCGEVLYELNQFPRLIEHFRAYIEENRQGSNLPLAMYWVVRARWNLNEQEAALSYLREAVEKYGPDRTALGVDLILEEWVGRAKGAESAISRSAWKVMRETLDKAEKEKSETLALRLKRVLLYEPGIIEDRKNNLVNEIVKPENVAKASVGVLELMLDEAQKRNDPDFARLIAETVVKDFTETDYALDARMLLSRQAMDKKDFKTAMRHLNVIQEVYASSPQAADALLLLGDLYIKEGKYDQADECFKKVLGVREWRGPLWPAALYGRGECAKLRKSYEQACAYYERIYLLYGHYKQWSARAYLARADCLAKLMQYVKAVETLEAMLSSPELIELPEAKEAREKLEFLKRRV